MTAYLDGKLNFRLNRRFRQSRNGVLFGQAVFSLDTKRATKGGTSAGPMGNYWEVWEQICAGSFSGIISRSGSGRHAFRKSVTIGDWSRCGDTTTFTDR